MSGLDGNVFSESEFSGVLLGNLRGGKEGTVFLVGQMLPSPRCQHGEAGTEQEQGGGFRDSYCIKARQFDVGQLTISICTHKREHR